MTAEPLDAREAASRFDDLFRQIYATFHRRDGTRRPLSAASLATLTHLAFAGPVTVGEAAEHLSRSQSTTSEILDQLQSHGLVQRRPDPDNRRRTLVWLTPDGIAAIRQAQSVLGLDLLTAAFERIDPVNRGTVLAALNHLLEGQQS